MSALVTAIGSGAFGVIGLVLVTYILNARWSHGDEPVVAMLLLGASFASILGVMLALLTAKLEGMRSLKFWLALSIAVTATICTLRAWNIL